MHVHEQIEICVVNICLAHEPYDSNKLHQSTKKHKGAIAHSTKQDCKNKIIYM